VKDKMRSHESNNVVIELTEDEAERLSNILDNLDHDNLEDEDTEFVEELIETLAL
jgi:hypothetical protein